MDNKSAPVYNSVPVDAVATYQLIVTICKLAGNYYHASVEKIDHLFFRGNKVPIKQELIDFLKNTPVSHVLTTEKWEKTLVKMGYDSDQINDFEALELTPGQGTLVEGLASYAKRHPDHPIYTALETMLKDYSHDPVLASLPEMFQTSEAQVHSLFTMAYHYLDTMSPLEADLNLFAVYFEPYFQGYRDTTAYGVAAQILGQIGQVTNNLSSDVDGIASEYVRSRAVQLGDYAHLNFGHQHVADSLQGFTNQLAAELRFLETQWSGKNLKQAFETLVRPENVWLENNIAVLELSQDGRERKKGNDIRAAYLAIPCEERNEIALKMSQTNLQRASPVGKLKHALDESTARFKLFDMSTKHHLSQKYQEEYINGRVVGDAIRDDQSIDTDTNSSNSGRNTPL